MMLLLMDSVGCDEIEVFRDGLEVFRDELEVLCDELEGVWEKGEEEETG